MERSQLIKLIRESGLFDDLFYLRQSNNLIDTELTLIEHYLDYGAKNGLNPSNQFDTSFYLSQNPNIVESGINPLVHYLTIGKVKGLLPEGKQPLVQVKKNNQLPKLIAFYLPQFHPIPENDEWWGKGFTEWTNVTKARPLFKGHQQPRLPSDLGFYDLRLPETREAQAELARAYGIHGFCYYYYWFNGRRLLERPLNEVLKSGKPDLPFCICWANENWTRRWDGRDQEILMGQEHSPESDLQFIRDIIPILKDPRYIRVNNRPLLLVYRANLLPEPRQTADRWRNECQKSGVGDILLGACRAFSVTDPRPFGFDLAVDFPPNNSNAPRIEDQLQNLDPNFAGAIYDYAKCVENNLKDAQTPYPCYHTAMLGWDNTARRGATAHIFHGATPAIYQKWLQGLLARAERDANPFEPLVFINAWNEWAEGTYLEPDQEYGKAYLEATSSAFNHFEQQLTSPDLKGSYAFLFEKNPKSPGLSQKPEVSIIIPVFNKVELTLECLKSLHFHSSQWQYEVIVVDDGSSDDTQALISAMPRVRYIRSQQNQGFIGSCNLGANQAQGNYLVFLNNDTTVCDGWLDALRGTFDSWSKAGLVGSKLIFPNGKLQECGGLIFKDGSAANYGRGNDPEHPSYCFAHEMDYVSGAAIMIARDLFLELGSFDDCYRPAYYEDVDLAFKVRQRGLQVIANPFARVIHYEGGTSGTDLKVGAKKYQVINQSTFYERWKEVLKSHPKRSHPLTLNPNYYSSRVLVIDWVIPRPDVDAGSVRMAAMLRILRELNCHVTLAARDLSYDPQYANPFELVGIEVLRHPFINNLNEYLQLYGNSFDYIIVSRRDVASMYIDDLEKYCPNAEVIFDTVDLHFLREERQQQLLKTNNGHKGLNKNGNGQKNLELDLVKRTDMTIVVSAAERDVLHNLTSKKDVRIIPTIYDASPTQRPFNQRNGILFIGYFAHVPNADAVLWFAKEILPLLSDNGKLPQFHIIGSNPPKDVLNLASETIKVHGFVQDPTSFFDECKLSVAPLRFGAGVKGKINQSMALGLPCVATSIGVEGMHLIDEVNILIADDAKTFATKVKHLYQNETLWHQLREAGLKNIEDYFSVSVAKKVLQSVISKS